MSVCLFQRTESAEPTKYYITHIPKSKAECRREMEIVSRNVIYKYPTNHFIFQHRDLYSQRENLSKRQRKMVHQDLRRTLGSRFHGNPQAFFPKEKK